MEKIETFWHNLWKKKKTKVKEEKDNKENKENIEVVKQQEPDKVIVKQHEIFKGKALLRR